MYLNKVQIIGNVTRDPELKSLPSGVQVANFGVATNHTYKDKEGKKVEETEFHNIVAFGKSAEILAQYAPKGKKVYIEGRMKTRNWEADGVKHYRTEIIADAFQLGSGKGESTAKPTEDVNADEPPF